MKATQVVSRLSRSWRPVVVVLAILCVVVGIFSGCTLKLIGDYDDTIDKGVTDLQQKTEVYFVKLQSAPATPYDQSVYDDLDARLAVLKSRAAALPQYGIITEQVANLKSQVDKFQQLDRISPRPLSTIIVTAPESAIAISVESILKLELALKRGDTSSATK